MEPQPGEHHLDADAATYTLHVRRGGQVLASVLKHIIVL